MGKSGEITPPPGSEDVKMPVYLTSPPALDIIGRLLRALRLCQALEAIICGDKLIKPNLRPETQPAPPVSRQCQQRTTVVDDHGSTEWQWHLVVVRKGTTVTKAKVRSQWAQPRGL